jgi:hypothetical protein
MEESSIKMSARGNSKDLKVPIVPYSYLSRFACPIRFKRLFIFIGEAPGFGKLFLCVAALVHHSTPGDGPVGLDSGKEVIPGPSHSPVLAQDHQ